jgi:hypothetical protein
MDPQWHRLDLSLPFSNILRASNTALFALQRANRLLRKLEWILLAGLLVFQLQEKLEEL